MRDIKFRGLDLEDGKWVYGSHLKTGVGLEYIVPQNLLANYLPQYTVDKDTVCQNTGLKDKNGKDIYEGDIVIGAHRSQRDDERIFIEQEVSFLNGCYMFGNWNAHEYFNKHTEIKVIGNIYENKELLEG